MTDEGIGVVDETSFRKKGTYSVGVARQYLGTAGKLENGQVATVLSYADQRRARVSRSTAVPAGSSGPGIGSDEAEAHVPRGGAL